MRDSCEVERPKQEAKKYIPAPVVPPARAEESNVGD